MYVAGCDTGTSGAIAILDGSGRLVEVYDMPTLRTGKGTELDGPMIRAIFSKVDHVVLEKAQAMPAERVKDGKVVKQGISSTAHYMKGAGILEGICIGLSLPYTLVAPVSWKSKLMKDMPKEKEASIIRVRQLFPGVTLPRKKDHGKADAILIGLYGIMYLVGRADHVRGAGAGRGGVNL